MSIGDIKNSEFRRIDRYPSDLKHILIWSDLQGVKYEGQRHFLDKHCGNVNCYFSRNRSLLGDIRYFDAIVYNLQDVSCGAGDLPTLRGQNQKYIFAANDSDDNYPVCHPAYDGFFNWTWTYRRDSTIPYKFISVYTLDHQRLYNDITFRKDMDALPVFQKHQISSKYKAAATFLDKCESKSKREDLIRELETELNKFNLSVDIYGKCGPLKCRRKTLAPCYYRLKKQYFFFLALEDSNSPDYVTDMVLHAFKNDLVPVVSGGAEYNLFLPQNSYLDVRTFYNTTVLAQKMHSLMRRKSEYYDLFRWKNHYSFQQGDVLDPCSLCETLNMPSMLVGSFVYERFREWWHPQYKVRCSQSGF